MLIMACLTAIYLVAGGYIATSYTDLVQGIIMIAGVICLVAAVFRHDSVDGISGLIRNLSNFEPLPGDPNPVTGSQLTNIFGGSSFKFLCINIMLTSFGTWGLPQMIGKFYAIKDTAAIKRGTIISTIFCVVIGCGAYMIGSASRLVLSGQLPEGGVDYIVPHILAQSQLPNILLGIVLMLLISASVSTLSSITITACSTVTMDIVVAQSKKEISKTSQALLTKILCIAFVAISYFIANSDTPILDMMSYSWGIISGSFLAPYAIALYWRGLNRKGAWAGMLGGFITALPPVVAKLFINSWQAPFGLGSMMDQGPLFACLAMVISVILCVAVSLATGGNTAEGREESKFFYEGRMEGSLAEAD